MTLKKKQQDILDQAVPLLKEKGFAGTSMRDLAAAMDVKAASLYAHLQSKEQILEWLCFGMAERFFTTLDEVRTSNVYGREKLIFFVEKHLEVVLANPDITGIYTNEWRHLGARSDEFHDLRRRYEKAVEALLEDVLLEMELPTGDLRFTTKYLLYTLNSSYLWFRKTEQNRAAMIEKILKKVLFGLIGK